MGAIRPFKPRRKVDLETRFWSKVAKKRPDECWPWTAYVKQYEYGMFNIDRRPHLAHRVAYALTHGRIPTSLVVMHSCDNPRCCNPAHLSLGTHKDNMADMRAKNRHPGAKVTHCPRGHEYTPENTYRNHLNGRMCKICSAARKQAHKSILIAEGASQ